MKGEERVGGSGLKLCIFGLLLRASAASLGDPIIPAMVHDTPLPTSCNAALAQLLNRTYLTANISFAMIGASGTKRKYEPHISVINSPLVAAAHFLKNRKHAYVS